MHLTPLLEQYQKIKNKYKDVLLLFRVGDFYEFYYEDAKLASSYLGITLTSKTISKGARVPLAGVPIKAADGYIAKLVKHGLKVAICEQLEDPKQAKGLVKRGITEIITPGTAVNDKFLDSNVNNYLAAWVPGDKNSALAFVDISTGEFRYVYAGNDSIIELIEAKPIAELLVPEHDDEYIRSLLPHYNNIYRAYLSVLSV